jgi:hypothetical protein
MIRTNQVHDLVFGADTMPEIASVCGSIAERIAAWLLAAILLAQLLKITPLRIALAPLCSGTIGTGDRPVDCAEHPSLSGLYRGGE